MPFGLRNVDQYFQSLTDDVLRVLSFTYISDVFTTYNNIDGNLENLQLVLNAAAFWIQN